MGKEEAIKDFSYRTIGYYEYMPNGDIIVKNTARQVLGYYRKQYDHTTDFYGHVIARGNAVGMLIKK